MNEQADYLCEGSQRRERERGEQGHAGADTVVFGMLNTQSADGRFTPQSTRSLGLDVLTGSGVRGLTSWSLVTLK